VVNLVLDGIVGGVDLDELARGVRQWHDERRSTFPAEVLLELAADAYLSVGSTRAEPLELEGLESRLLAVWPARRNIGHQKRRHALLGAIAIAAGAEPEDTGWWTVDDLWLHALLAAVIFVRAAAERRRVDVGVICAELRPV
jgi:hypothetical protein